MPLYNELHKLRVQRRRQHKPNMDNNHLPDTGNIPEVIGSNLHQSMELSFKTKNGD
jgi:hypothetical protein